MFHVCSGLVLLFLHTNKEVFTFLYIFIQRKYSLLMIDEVQVIYDIVTLIWI